VTDSDIRVPRSDAGRTAIGVVGGILGGAIGAGVLVLLFVFLVRGAYEGG